MGAIARQREARFHEVAGEMETERIRPAASDNLRLAQMAAKASRHFGVESRFIQRQHCRRLVGALGPYQRRSVFRHRQNRERPRRQEMLIGDAIMRPFVGDGGDDAGLGIGPADGADALLAAQF